MPSPLVVRWTKADQRADLPERFAKALERSGGEQASKLRALVRCWTEEIERIGHDPLLARAVRAVITKRPAKQARKL